ncbi:MAG: bifunctional nicotinamidase/pyrazinamidase [Granulosicoccaceae bacterium]
MIEFSARSSDALLIIDVQNDFCTDGALAVPDGEAVVPLINQLAAQFATVVATQDWHPAGHSSFASSHESADPFSMTTMPYGEQTLWPDHCIQNTNGAQFHTSLEMQNIQCIIRKGFRSEVDSYSAFYENDKTTTTGLSGLLHERDIKRLVCVGLAYDFCVRFSAEDAHREGFETIVLIDACRAIDLEGSADAANQALSDLGVSIR